MTWWSIKPELEGREILLSKNIIEDCFAEGDENQLFEALVTIIRTAAESLFCGGEVAITMEVKGDDAVLRVSSSGSIRDQENVDTIREPCSLSPGYQGKGMEFLAPAPHSP